MLDRLLTFRAAPGPDDNDPVFAAASTLLNETSAKADLQSFIFSATMSKDLQHNLKRRQKRTKPGTKRATALGERY